MVERPDWDNAAQEGKRKVLEYQQTIFFAVFGQREPDFASMADPTSDDHIAAITAPLRLRPSRQLLVPNVYRDATAAVGSYTRRRPAASEEA